MCYIVVLLRDMVKERWWSATDIKHVKTCYLRDRVSLGFRDRVKVRVSFRLATFMYPVCPPVPHFPYAKPQKFLRPFLTSHLTFIMYNFR